MTTPSSARTTNQLLTVLAVVASIFFLKWAASVLLPVVFALFIVAVFWPIYRAQARKIPRGLAAVGTLLLFLCCVAGLGTALYFSAEQVASANSFASYKDKLQELQSGLISFGEKAGVDESQMNVQGSLKDTLKTTAQSLQGFIVGGTLMLAFFTLALLEVEEYGERIRRHLPENHSAVIDVVNRVARNFQRYIVIRTGIGLLTGIAVTAAALLIGLDFAVIWGVINFLLNYVPTIGSILGVIPPAIFAFVQFDDPKMILITLASVGGVQLLMGNYVDPLVQGKYLKLSPVVVLFAVTFWSFIWGIVGALIAVPLTVLLALVLKEFPATRFMGSLITAAKSDSEE